MPTMCVWTATRPNRSVCAVCPSLSSTVNTQCPVPSPQRSFCKPCKPPAKSRSPQDSPCLSPIAMAPPATSAAIAISSWLQAAKVPETLQPAKHATTSIPGQGTWLINQCKTSIKPTGINTKHMATTKWVLDPTHAEIQFKVKHLMISTVTGQFKEFEGDVETK